MGVLSRVRHPAGSVPKELLEHGLVGRGTVVSVQRTSVSTGEGSDLAHVCVFTVRVSLGKAAPFTATCRQAVRARVLPELMRSGATVAVRIDPRDHSYIALSLGERPPSETAQSQTNERAA